MAQHEELPVYKASYDLLQEIYRATATVPRDIRFTLLKDVKHSMMALMVNIYKANRHRDKQPYIAAASDSLIEARLGLRLMKDLHALGLKQFARLSQMSAEVSKQLAGWQKYSTDRNGRNDPDHG